MMPSPKLPKRSGPVTFDVIVSGWLSREVAQQFAVAIQKQLPLPGVEVRVVRVSGDRA